MLIRKRKQLKEKNLKNPSKRILLILTGSIASAKSGDLIKELRGRGWLVTCVLTRAAEHFVTPLAVRAFSGQPVYGEFFSPETPYDVLHTALAEESDLILAAPASADFIARLAAGMADDLASCIILAARKPIVVAPAMNDVMYQHPLTQRNLEVLRSSGYHVIDPIEGDLVCGKTAIGHIPEPRALGDAVQKILGA